MKNYIGKIKVNSKIKPLKIKNRIKPTLEKDREYYISFGNNNAYPCRITEILQKQNMVNINIKTKPMSKKGYIDLNGQVSHNWVSSHTIYMNEIGDTPENAVKNTVTL
jgi:hypothetical protein